MLSVLCSICVHVMNKETSQQASQERSKEDRKRDGRHAKNILTKGPNRANKHAKHMVGQANMLSNKRWCPRRTNVGLD